MNGICFHSPLSSWRSSVLTSTTTAQQQQERNDGPQIKLPESLSQQSWLLGGLLYFTSWRSPILNEENTLLFQKNTNVNRNFFDTTKQFLKHKKLKPISVLNVSLSSEILHLGNSFDGHFTGLFTCTSFALRNNNFFSRSFFRPDVFLYGNIKVDPSPCCPKGGLFY